MFELCSVCGRCAGYIFVTRKQMGWVVRGGGLGYIFVTRNAASVALVVRLGMCGLQKWEK